MANEDPKKKLEFKDLAGVVKDGATIIAGVSAVAAPLIVSGPIGWTILAVGVGGLGVWGYKRVQRDLDEKKTAPVAPSTITAQPSTALTLRQKQDRFAAELIALKKRADAMLGRITILADDKGADELGTDYWKWTKNCTDTLSSRLSVVEAHNFMNAAKARRYDSKLTYLYQIKEYRLKNKAPKVFETAELLTQYSAALGKLIQEVPTMTDDRLP